MVAEGTRVEGKGAGKAAGEAAGEAAGGAVRGEGGRDPMRQAVEELAAGVQQLG